jgi:colanic acid biosynthesis glycosyl transferase WcaI
VRILIHGINCSPELTGVGKYTGEMVEWLARRGHEVRVVTAPPYYPEWRVLKGYSSWRFRTEKHVVDSGHKFIIFRCPLWVPRAPRGWQRILHLLSFSFSSFLKMLSQTFWRPDIVFLIEPTICCFPQVLSVARLSGAIAWLHVQDFEMDAGFALGDLHSGAMKRTLYAFEGFLMRRFDRVSTISRRMVERLAAKGVESARRLLFPNWVDTSTIFPLSTQSPLREELGIPREAIIALYSGNMGKKQGLELLVEVSRQLASRPDIRFVFCGDGSYRETFVRMVEKFRNAMFLPLQPEHRLNDLLNLGDIHLLPQRADAADLVMPSKLTGMFASGRAVIATAAEGTQLASVLKGRGIATPPNDADAFVSALVKLADDPAMRQRMGEEGRKYAIHHLDRDKILLRFEAVITEACGHPGFCPKKSSPQSEI